MDHPRSIRTTHKHDVCDVCARTLLRGEQDRDVRQRRPSLQRLRTLQAACPARGLDARRCDPGFQDGSRARPAAAVAVRPPPRQAGETTRGEPELPAEPRTLDDELVVRQLGDRASRRRAPACQRRSRYRPRPPAAGASRSPATCTRSRPTGTTRSRPRSTFSTRARTGGRSPVSRAPWARPKSTSRLIRHTRAWSGSSSRGSSAGTATRSTSRIRGARAAGRPGIRAGRACRARADRQRQLRRQRRPHPALRS